MTDRAADNGDASGGTLSPQESRFVEEYLVDLNATAAYRRVYRKAGYNTARNNAARLLAKADIRAAVAAGRRRLSTRSKIDALRVIRELARVAFSDVGDLVGGGPSGWELRPLRRVPADARRAVASVKRRRTAKGDDVTEVRLHSKLEALDRLARHLGLFADLPPLTQLLNNLPPDLAGVVRDALKAAVGPAEGGA